MNRYLYSIVKFVPSPIRGEFINLGIVAGCDETGEWRFCPLNRDGRRRAKWIDDDKIFPNVAAELERIDSWVNDLSTLDYGDGNGPSESWLLSTSRHSMNVIQFSYPRPAAAESVDDVVERLWTKFIVEPEPQERDGLSKKTVALRYMRELKRFVRKENLKVDAQLDVAGARATVDVSVFDDVAKELTQCWSLQVKTQQPLLESVRAWGFTMRQLRDQGGSLVIGDRVVRVPAETRLSVVFAKPRKKSELVDEIYRVFDERHIHAIQVPLEDSAAHARQTAELVHLF